MTFLVRFSRQFLANQDGPTAVEYAVMLSVLAAVMAAGARTLATSNASSFSSANRAFVSGGKGGDPGSITTSTDPTAKSGTPTVAGTAARSTADHRMESGV